jgi:hypothetical protein
MLTDRYWVYKDGFLQGPLAVEELVRQDWFSETMIVCQDGDDVWKPAHDVAAIADCLTREAPSKVVSTGDYRPVTPPTPEQPSPTLSDRPAGRKEPEDPGANSAR